MKHFLTLLSLIILLTYNSPAQMTRGTILGVIQDPSGATISNASVKIVNSATGVERTTTSGSDGSYRFAGVDPGLYNVTFTATGFATSEVKNINVSTSQEVTLNQQLAVGATTSTVDVSDTPPGVELSKSSA